MSPQTENLPCCSLVDPYVQGWTCWSPIWGEPYMTVQGAGKTRELEFGESVLARNYRGDHKWTHAKVKQSHTVEIAPDTTWRRHIDQLIRSNVPLGSGLVSVPFTTTDTVTSESDTTTPQGGTVSPCEAPQTPIPTCGEKRYPTRVQKPPTHLDL